mmetsp:Transcript_11299/g.34458  ORF Transcript_11299/g.34458 Transcript_11299/m.34458 type:complete len:314 (-) Transcript_11299:1086-2027(-)
MLQVDLTGHVHRDLELAGPPGRVHVVPAQVDHKVGRECLEANAPSGHRLPSQGGRVEVVHIIVLGKSVQARREGNLGNDLRLLCRHPAVALLPLPLPVLILLDVLGVCGLAHRHAERQNVVRPGLVHHLPRLGALKSVLKLKREGGGHLGVRFRKERCLRPLRPGSLLQKVLEELDRVLLPRRPELWVSTTDEGLEHVRRHTHRLAGVIFLPLHTPRQCQSGAELRELDHQAGLGLPAAAVERGGELAEDLLSPLSKRFPYPRAATHQLHHGVHVAAIAEILHSDKPRAPRRHQYAPLLRDGIELVLGVQIDL